MSNGRNWSRALDRERTASARAEQRDLDAHIRAMTAAHLGARAEQLTKSELRAIADRALAEFSGTVQHLPMKRRGQM